MQVSSDRLSLLMSYGLSEYQARAYLALLQIRSSTVGELAKTSGLPRNRLYDVLADLQAIDLVEIHLEGMRRYRAKPISSYLDRRVKDLESRIREIESRRPVLEVAFQPPPLEETRGPVGTGLTRAILGRRAVSREIAALLAGAREEVVAVSSAGGLRRVAGYLDTYLPENPRLADVSVGVLVPEGVAHAALIEPVQHLVTEGVRRVRAPLGLLAFAADAREIILVQPIPDDAKLHIGQDFALASNNPAFARDYLALLKAATLPE